MKKQREILLVSEREAAARYRALEEENEGMSEDVRQRSERISGLEFEKLELLGKVTALESRLANVESELDKEAEAHAASAEAVRGLQGELKGLVQELAKARAQTTELRAEKQMLEEIVEEHESAHARKDSTVREALRLGRRALAERNELARRLRETHDELQVQIAMAVAEGGHMHVEQLGAVTTVMGPTPADPDAPTPAESVIDEEDLAAEEAGSEAASVGARGKAAEGQASATAGAAASRAGRALDVGDFEELEEAIEGKGSTSRV